MQKKRLYLVLIALLLLALSLAQCTGDTEEPAEPEAAAPAQEEPAQPAEEQNQPKMPNLSPEPNWYWPA